MEHEVLLTVLGLTTLLGVAVLLLPLAKRWNFPYTVLLAAFGCVLGFIVSAEGLEGWGPAGEVLGAVKGFGITAEVVFFVFLPALIFESALAIDVRRLFDDVVPILALAVIGLLVSTVVVGYSIWLVSGVGLVVCLLLGAIVSATDPVAVVAIFKDLGAPKRLAILVEGESLFNDATAIVLFTILAGMLIGETEPSLLGGVVTFFKVFVGGVVVGYLIARLVCFVIARLREVPLVEITLTIALAYLSFIVAEHYLHVSGVMAVVTAALVMGSYGRTTISPEAWHGLEETWEQLGFWANTLIFVLVGMAVPELMGDLGSRELLWLAALVVAAFAARAGVLFGLLPLLRLWRLADPVSNAYKTVMFWGGLRGAVSLALALTIVEDARHLDADRSFIGILVTGFVLVTLFFNALTIRRLMAWLGFDKLSPADLAVRNRVLAMSLANISDEVAAAARDQKVDPEFAEGLIGEYRERMAEVESNVRQFEGISDQDWLRIGIATLFNRERKLYLEHFAKGFVSAPATRLLLAKTDGILDGLKTGGIEGYEQAVRKSLGFSVQFRWALYVQRMTRIDRLLAQRLADRVEFLSVAQAVLGDLSRDALPQVASLLGEKAGAALTDHLARRLTATEQALAALRLQYPDYARSLQECYLARVALRLEDADYTRMLEESVISQEVYSDLDQDLRHRSKELLSRPQLDLGLDPEKLVAKVPFFASLEPARIAEIAKLLRPELVLPGEIVIRRGEVGDRMFFISNGSLEVDRGQTPIRLGSGDFFGEIALLTEKPRTADVKALGYCQLLTLLVRDFRRFIEQYPDLRAAITSVAEARLARDASIDAQAGENAPRENPDK